MIMRVLPIRAAGRLLLGRAQDRPGHVSALLVVLVTAHAALTGLGRLPNVWADLAASPQAVTIYLALAGPASIVSGFAGVVVVFGLTLGSIRFQRFRVRAGRRLRATWTSTSTSGFVAVALSLAAALLALAPAGKPGEWSVALAAPWVFELGVALLAHGVLRLVWILRNLVTLIQADDTEAVEEADRRPLDQMPFNRRRAS